MTTCTAISGGDLVAVSPTVGHLTGRPAPTFASWLDANPDQWPHLRRQPRDYAAVRMTGPDAVIAMVCSACAVREPSAERMVQPSASIT